ncbi:MAG TPA: hypothetical protein VGX03_10610 [Candidatus Binatia bacterium]|jgi:hypothetical protein|nr:hypothetical protein [Candidatus Binatia bacterium]
MKEVREALEVSPLVRIAVGCALVSLCCLSVFLWYGFTAWSVGVGIVMGVPLLAVAIGLYGVAVVRELHRYGEL